MREAVGLVHCPARSLFPGRISLLLFTSFALIGHWVNASCALAMVPGEEAPRVEGQPRGRLGAFPGAGEEQAAPDHLTPAPGPQVQRGPPGGGQDDASAAAPSRGQAAGRHHGGGQLLTGDGVHGAGRPHARAQGPGTPRPACQPLCLGLLCEWLVVWIFSRITTLDEEGFQQQDASCLPKPNNFNAFLKV